MKFHYLIPLILILLLGACKQDAPDMNLAEPCGDLAPATATGKASTWQPWEWKGHEKFPSLYFAANPEGYLTAAQMDKVSRFSLAIFEFRMGQWVAESTTGQWANGDLAGFMEEQCKRMKASHPNGPPCLVYRSGMWAGSMFKDQFLALQNQDLFIKDKRHCEGFIDYPLDVDESGEKTGLEYCRWDFRKCEARKTFLNLMEKAALEATEGIFFDNAQSVPCDEAQHLSYMDKNARRAMMTATSELYARVFSKLVSENKYPILSTTNGFSDIGAQVPWENDCPEAEEALLAALDGIPFARNNEFWMWNLGETAARQIRNSIRETERGIPIIVHQPYFPRDGGCLEGCQIPAGGTKSFSKDEFLEFGVAAFLVSMGPGSYYGFSDMQSDAEGGGWFDVSWEWHSQYDRIQTGAPKGAASVSADGMRFTREFDKGTVWVDCRTGEYSLGGTIQ